MRQYREKTPLPITEHIQLYLLIASDNIVNAEFNMLKHVQWKSF